jgi:hypothetical protein
VAIASEVQLDQVRDVRIVLDYNDRSRLAGHDCQV